MPRSGCKNHKVYADHHFTSIPLIRKLREDGIYYVGTGQKSRLQGAEKHLKTEKEMGTLGRGHISVATSSDGITVTRWMDNSVVDVVSSYAGKEPTVTCRRFSRKTKSYIDIPLPHSVAFCNKHMEGVDLMDSLVALYRNDLRNRRWYLRIFYPFLNIVICNGWIIWKREGKEKMD